MFDLDCHGSEGTDKKSPTKIIMQDTEYDTLFKPADDVWGSEGLNIYVIRVPINFMRFQHWSVAI